MRNLSRLIVHRNIGPGNSQGVAKPRLINRGNVLDLISGRRIPHIDVPRFVRWLDQFYAVDRGQQRGLSLGQWPVGNVQGHIPFYHFCIRIFLQRSIVHLAFVYLHARRLLG